MGELLADLLRLVPTKLKTPTGPRRKFRKYTYVYLYIYVHLASAPELIDVGRRPPLRYRCLLIDHDDTVVRGTEELHYPAHVKSIQLLRPDLTPCTLPQWFEKNHDPGVSAYLGSLFTKEQHHKTNCIMQGCG